MNTVDLIKELPENVQYELAGHLVGFSECVLKREFGSYKVEGDYYLDRGKKAPDFKVWEIHKEDVLKIEKLKNFIDEKAKEYGYI